METTRILDHYRINLINDQVSIKVLAYLYRDGSKTEKELIDQLKDSDEELKDAIGKLYRANFIRITTPMRWACTEFAEIPLSKFGIVQISINSLLASAKIPSKHYYFLKSCLDIQAEYDEDRLRGYNSLIRSLLLVNRLEGELKISQNRKIELLYSIIVGLDPESHRLGANAYYNVIANWHKAKQTDFWFRIADNYLENKKIYENLCKKGIEDVTKSDSVLIGELKFSPKNRTALLLTYTRLLGALLGKRADSGLAFAYRMNDQFFNVISILLDDISPHLEWQTAKVLEKDGRLPKATQKVHKKKAFEILQNALIEIFEGETNTSKSLKKGNLNSIHNYPALSVVEKSFVNDVIYQLEELDNILDTGKLDNVSVSEKERLLNAFDDSYSKFKLRLIEEDEIVDGSINEKRNFET